MTTYWIVTAILVCFLSVLALYLAGGYWWVGELLRRRRNSRRRGVIA